MSDHFGRDERWPLACRNHCVPPRGKRVSPPVLEETAKSSKRLWPGMATVFRTEPGYLARDHRYLLKGGTPNGTKMTAREVKSWGSTLLNSSYPCAFISWTYDGRFLSSRGMSDAMGSLRRKAQERNNRSCRSS